MSANRRVLVNPSPHKVSIKLQILFNRDNDGFTETKVQQESLSKVKHRASSSSSAAVIKSGGGEGDQLKSKCCGGRVKICLFRVYRWYKAKTWFMVVIPICMQGRCG